MTSLQARDVSVRYGDAVVLDAVSVQVRPGEVLALVGPNGAGKSTLLAALAGDLKPTGGEVTLGTTPVAEESALELARQRAVLLQQQSVAFGFTVRQVVAMGRAPWHRTEQADHDEEAVGEAMARADVARLAGRNFLTLSGGEQARTSFARVLAQDTPIVMLDEPTAALDIRHQESLLSIARDAAAAGSAVVVVLHDLSLAAAYADRICVLAEGRVRAEGRPEDVLTEALLSEVYAHPVEVVRHRGGLLVVPVRSGVEPAPAGEEVACVPAS